MKDTGKKNEWRIVGLISKAFILASVVGVFLPMPRYVGSLSPEEHRVWVARICWVLLLTVGFIALPLFVGFIAGRLRRKIRKNR